MKGQASEGRGLDSKGRGQVQEDVVTMDTDTENEEHGNSEKENLITPRSEEK